MAVVASGVLAWQANTRGLRQRLVREIRALAAARFPRPVQEPPVLPGRYGPRAAEAWTALAALEALSTDVEFCRAVREGETPVAKAPPSCLRELLQGESALEALLTATHAAEAGPPAGLGTLDVPAPLENPRTFVTAAYAARMSALRLRVELARGDTRAALSTCLNLLALARDTSWGTALEGRLAALTVSEVAFLPCAAALDAAPVAPKRRAELALARLAEGTPTLAESFEEWSVRVRAELYAPYLSEALPTLPEAVRAWASARQAPRSPSPGAAVAFGRAWHRLQARLDKVVEAARLPLPEAAERLSALSAAEEASFAALGQRDFPDLGAVASSDGRARAELLLLRRAAEVDALRAETGAWPEMGALPAALRATSTRPFSMEAKGNEVVLSDSSSPRGDLELRLHADPE
jgi:hypothetical protein